eukprot:TRINITY_DN2921_c0_g1_i1.p1 TRINITY_DN2921_c0_g1~~TRINITY_DN2921_c0_g1_i1.p1  ORF type:complete len:488 (-),score=143.12 TRINITY_DN2921_c0_g1_i1:113-1576(-)
MEAGVSTENNDPAISPRELPTSPRTLEITRGISATILEVENLIRGIGKDLFGSKSPSKPAAVQPQSAAASGDEPATPIEPSPASAAAAGPIRAAAAEPAVPACTLPVSEGHAWLGELPAAEAALGDGAQLERLHTLLASAPSVDLAALREVSWDGVPESLRGQVWPLLLGCLPPDKNLRATSLALHRDEYQALIRHQFSQHSAEDVRMLQQIRLDVPRTHLGAEARANPSSPPAEQQAALERMLFIWAKEHPAIGYFQGLSDLAALFVHVFSAASNTSSLELSSAESAADTATTSAAGVEADAYWCMSRFLSPMQDYYTDDLNDGLQALLQRLAGLTQLMDVRLATHLSFHGIDPIMYAVRWMLCLFTRELPPACVARLWDSYIADGPSFAEFHVFVCAALLCRFSPQLLERDFSDLMVLLQRLPCDDWQQDDIRSLIREAHELVRFEQCVVVIYMFGLMLVIVILAVVYIMFISLFKNRRLDWPAK